MKKYKKIQIDSFLMKKCWINKTMRKITFIKDFKLFLIEHIKIEINN